MLNPEYVRRTNQAVRENHDLSANLKSLEKKLGKISLNTKRENIPSHLDRLKLEVSYFLLRKIKNKILFAMFN